MPKLWQEPCTLMESITVPLPAGGNQTQWSDDAKFEAKISFNNSIAARVAGAVGTSTAYTVAGKDMPISVNSYIRRDNNGEYLKINNQPAVSHDGIPKSIAGKQFSAEHVDKLPV